MSKNYTVLDMNHQLVLEMLSQIKPSQVVKVEAKSIQIQDSLTHFKGWLTIKLHEISHKIVIEFKTSQLGDLIETMGELEFEHEQRVFKEFVTVLKNQLN